MDPQRNAPDQADRGWYDRRHGEPEWEGYRLPGPRGAGESLEADPLSGGPRAAAQPAYDQQHAAPQPAYDQQHAPPQAAYDQQHAPPQAAYDQQSGYNPLAAPAMEVPAYGGPPVPAPAAVPQVPPPPPGYQSFEEPTGAVPPVTPRAEAESIETQRFQTAPAAAQHFHTEAIDRAALRRPAAPAPDGVYRTKRPAAGIVFAVLAVVFEIPALRLLGDAAIGGPVVASGVVAGTFLVAGLPLVALGLYALVTGANRLPSDGGGGAQAWLRPPTAYLPVGLVLLVAAALAA
ncbi:hypothetical protein ACTMTJ_07035 [Phytohabitans sp. LJ34]|uniref:hypothetical protein n=1 Tax=Phytohabitans sp. LJ34 TaxID=3452217 RepID=UPI003F8BF037